MKEIKFKDTINWGISDPPRGIYKSKICIKGFLSKKSLLKEQIENYYLFKIKDNKTASINYVGNKMLAKLYSGNTLKKEDIKYTIEKFIK